MSEEEEKAPFPPVMSEEQAEKFLAWLRKKYPKECPYCKSKNIYTQTCVFGAETWDDYQCEDCKKTFNEGDRK